MPLTRGSKSAPQIAMTHALSTVRAGPKCVRGDADGAGWAAGRSRAVGPGSLLPPPALAYVGPRVAAVPARPALDRGMPIRGRSRQGTRGRSGGSAARPAVRA